METKEHQPVPDYIEKFDNTPVGGLVKLPISKILPTDVDDGRQSMTSGPIEVYKEEKTGRIFVYDGNHRRNDKEIELIIKLGYENRDSEPVEVKKVINDKPWG